MLVAATALLERNPSPDESEVMDAIGGVLCRCTGYRKIISAILEARASRLYSKRRLRRAHAVGSRLVRLDGKKKVDGSEIFGADEIPAGALGVRVHSLSVSPGAISDSAIWIAFVADHPGVVLVLTAKDVPGSRLLWRDSPICGSAGVCAR